MAFIGAQKALEYQFPSIVGSLFRTVRSVMTVQTLYRRFAASPMLLCEHCYDFCGTES
jgi:hypothetical protein